MLRIRLDALDGRGELYSLGGRLFTGLAYRVSGQGVVEELLEIEDGTIKAASDDLLPLPEGALRVDRRLLDMEEDYGPWLYQGGLFAGLAYAFDRNGFCMAEAEYEDGVESGRQHRSWYPGGEPKTAGTEDGGFAWFPDGRVRAAVGPEGTLLNLILDDQGLLEGIYCEDADLLQPEGWKDLPLHQTFSLLGSAFDLPVLIELMRWLDFSGVRHFTIDSTSLAPEALAELARLTVLETVVFAENRRLGRDDAVELKRRRPAMNVLFDEERIGLEPSSS